RPEQVWAAEVAGDLGEVLGSSPALGVLGLAAEDLVEVGADRAEELRVVIGQLPAGGVLDGRLAGDPGGQALTADDPLDGLVGTVAHLGAVEAAVQHQLRLAGDGVIRVPGDQGSHGDHREVVRVYLAAHDALQAHDDHRRDVAGVESQVRGGGVRGQAGDRHGDGVA